MDVKDSLISLDKDIAMAFSGSGTNYPVFVGAYRALYERGYRASSVAGTSGGAIIAALIASGYTNPDELEAVVLEFLPGPNKLIDWAPLSFWQGGVIDGDRILKKLKKVLVSKMKDTSINCAITATNINDKGTYIFSSKTSPDLYLAEVVRASIAIPFVFKPVELTGFQKGHYFIDGGVGNNFPLDSVTGPVVGFRCLSPESQFVRQNYVYNPFERARRIIDIFQEAINRKHIEDADYKFILNLYGDPNSFNIYMKEVEAGRLIRKGYNQACKTINQLLNK